MVRAKILGRKKIKFHDDGMSETDDLEANRFCATSATILSALFDFLNLGSHARVGMTDGTPIGRVGNHLWADQVFCGTLDTQPVAHHQCCSPSYSKSNCFPLPLSNRKPVARSSFCGRKILFMLEVLP